ncbi:hypothetical protein F4780DRAFT_766889, partial [Xylariomycetidae sp. FL0641]
MLIFIYLHCVVWLFQRASSSVYLRRRRRRWMQRSAVLLPASQLLSRAQTFHPSLSRPVAWFHAITQVRPYVWRQCPRHGSVSALGDAFGVDTRAGRPGPENKGNTCTSPTQSQGCNIMYLITRYL